MRGLLGDLVAPASSGRRIRNKIQGGRGFFGDLVASSGRRIRNKIHDGEGMSAKP
jgi:hypothetical protein